jgi:hypothetical protein
MKLIVLTAAVFFFGPFCRHAGTRGRRDAPGARSSAAPAGSRSEELLLYGRRSGVRQDFERLDVKMTLGAARRRARVSGGRRLLPRCRGGFPTIGRGQNLSSARVEP